MLDFIANARLFSPTPAVEAAWRRLIELVLAEAGLDGRGDRPSFRYLPHPEPRGLDGLWARDDVGAVLVPGIAIARGLAGTQPIAAPVPDLDWAGGQPRTRAAFLVRADAKGETLTDLAGGRIGWTAEWSDAGFNALRHRLMSLRQGNGGASSHTAVGPLGSDGQALRRLIGGEVDLVAVDGYWLALMAAAEPTMLKAVRTIETGAILPMPAFVAGPMVEPDMYARLKAAFLAASGRPWFERVGKVLALKGFAAVTAETYAPAAALEAEAIAAGSAAIS